MRCFLMAKCQRQTGATTSRVMKPPRDAVEKIAAAMTNMANAQAALRGIVCAFSMNAIQKGSERTIANAKSLGFE